MENCILCHVLYEEEFHYNGYVIYDGTPYPLCCFCYEQEYEDLKNCVYLKC